MSYKRLVKFNYCQIFYQKKVKRSWSKDLLFDIELLINKLQINNMGGHSAGFKVTLGRSNQSTLNRDSLHDLLIEINNNKDILSGAVLKARDEIENEVEIINLFDNIYNEFLIFDLAERTSLSFDYCVKKMTEKYLENKEDILNKIKE